jgi:nucleotide-binding universal stress UspA family protein
MESPFKNVAMALAYSPRWRAMVSESVRVAERFDANLYLMHVGPEIAEEVDELEKLLEDIQCNRSKIHVINQDGQPVETLLALCRDYKIDLLIAGALQRENIYNFYMGSIARNLCRKTDLSLMLMISPEERQHPCKRIVVNGNDHPKTFDTIRVAMKVAESLESAEVHIIEEIEPSKVGIKVDDDKSLEKAHIITEKLQADEMHRVEDLIARMEDHPDIDLHNQAIVGKKGSTIGQYALAKKADLLILNSPDTKLGILDRVFTHDLEYILQDLPCDILIVHSSRTKRFR